MVESLEITPPSGPHTVGASQVHGAGLPATEEKDNLLWREERRAKRRQAKQERMSERQRRFGLLLCVVSVFDVLISGVMMVSAFSLAYRDNGVSLYCVGIQASSHLLSSVLLVGRFWGEYTTPEETPAGRENGLLREQRRGYLAREKCLSFFMGIVMMVSSVALVVKAIRKIIYWDLWYADHRGMDSEVKFATMFLAWYGVIVYGGQAIVRGFVANALRRSVVWLGLTCSLVSILYLFVIGVAAAMEDEFSWKAEPIAAAVLAVVTVAEGTRLIYTHRGDIDTKLDFDPWA